MNIYQLKSENLSGLGGPMGTEHTTINWVKPFDSLESAKAYAENDYSGNEIVSWKKSGKGWSSQDLSYVMYYIEEVKLGSSTDIKPKMLVDSKIKLENLKSITNDYIDFVSSEEYHEDNDYKQYIYEEVMKTFYGKDIFKYINNKLR